MSKSFYDVPDEYDPDKTQSNTIAYILLLIGMCLALAFSCVVLSAQIYVFCS